MKKISTQKNQRGITIYTVIVVMLLSMLLALWASRTAIFSELVTGNDADYQRAFEAAQAMIQDAQQDIYRNLYDKNQPTTRQGSTTTLPANQASFIDWASQMTTPPHCSDGVCLRIIGAENFWDDETALASMLATGARYGTYSGAATATDKNPILNFDAPNKGAWYWIEPIQFKGSEIGSKQSLLEGKVAASPQADMVFRITSVAFGLKGSSDSIDIADRSKTMAVIQTIIALPPNPGE